MLSPCRTEWMYRSDVLWHLPNYEFAGIYSDTEWMAGHIKAGDVNEFGGDWRISPPHRRPVQRAQDRRSTPSESTDARQPPAGSGSHHGLPAHHSPHGRMERRREDTRHRRIPGQDDERPDRARAGCRWTRGPLIYPDFQSDEQSEIRKLQFAFVCYNTDDVAEFVLRGPTPVTGGRPRGGRLHRLLRHPARPHPKHLLRGDDLRDIPVWRVATSSTLGELLSNQPLVRGLTWGSL